MTGNLIYTIERAMNDEWNKTGSPLRGTLYVNVATRKKHLDRYHIDCHPANIYHDECTCPALTHLNLRFGDMEIVVDEALPDEAVVISWSKRPEITRAEDV